MALLPPSRDDDARLRRVVVRHLELSYGAALGREDREDLYQEAWACATEYEARGERIRDLRAFLKTVADRRARDRIRNKSATAVDPADRLFELLLDEDPTPDEAAQTAIDGATVWRIAAELSELETRVIEKRYWEGLQPKEIVAELGLERNRFNRTLAAALDKIAAALRDHDAWVEQHRELFVRCLAQTASQAELERARALVRSDPKARALLRELRRASAAVAAIGPVPLALSGQSSAGSLAEQAGAALQSAKQQLAGLSARIFDPTPLAGARPGSMAAAIAGCIAIGGGATYCAVEGVPEALRVPLGIERAADEQSEKEKRADAGEPRDTTLEAPAPVTQEAPSEPSNPAPVPSPEPAPAQAPEPALAPEPPPPPPAEQASREFGFEQAAPPASTSAPSRDFAAPSAPTSGGGSSGAGSSSGGSTEFGFEN